MIIGSLAIKHHFPDHNREVKDIDIAISSKHNPEINSQYRIERLENSVLLDYVKEVYGYMPEYCPPDELYTLKISHIFWDVFWEKNMWDTVFLQEKGCKLIRPLFDKLYQYWNKVHGKNKRSDLKMSAEDFFDNALNYHIDHDTMHEMLIKHPYFENQDKPTYTLILKDGAEVEVDENKYNNLTEQQKFNLVFEEVAVMATERYSKRYYKAAYNRMLKKFIIGHAPIWEALWIIENYKNLSTNIPFNFLKFLNENGNNNDN